MKCPKVKLGAAFAGLLSRSLQEEISCLSILCASWLSLNNEYAVSNTVNRADPTCNLILAIHKLSINDPYNDVKNRVLSMRGHG